MEMNLFTFLPFFQAVGTIGTGAFFSLLLKRDLHRLQGELKLAACAQRNATEVLIQKPGAVLKV